MLAAQRVGLHLIGLSGGQVIAVVEEHLSRVIAQEPSGHLIGLSVVQAFVEQSAITAVQVPLGHLIGVVAGHVFAVQSA